MGMLEDLLQLHCTWHLLSLFSYVHVSSTGKRESSWNECRYLGRYLAVISDNSPNNGGNNDSQSFALVLATSPNKFPLNTFCLFFRNLVLILTWCSHLMSYCRFTFRVTRLPLLLSATAY